MAASMFPVPLSGIQTSTLTTTGDTVYASAANVPARLGVGTTGQVLTVASGIPSWATPSSITGWTSYTPTYTNFTLGNGTTTAAYRDNGDMVDVFVRIVLGSTSSITGTWKVSLPLSANNTMSQVVFMGGVFNDNGAYYIPSGALIDGTTHFVPCSWFVNNGVMGQDWLFQRNATATLPWTWGTSDNFTIQFSYRKA